MSLSNLIVNVAGVGPEGTDGNGNVVVNVSEDGAIQVGALPALEPSSGVPSGAAGGGLAGTYPDPVLSATGNEDVSLTVRTLTVKSADNITNPTIQGAMENGDPAKPNFPLGLSGGADPTGFNLTAVGEVQTYHLVAETGGLGFFNQTVGQPEPAAIPDAAGGVTQDAEARAAINSLLAAMRTLGLIAT